MGGVRFDVLEASLTVGSTPVRQECYAAIMKGYALFFLVTFNRADQEAVLRRTLDSISFQ